MLWTRRFLLSSGRLVVSSGISRLTVLVDDTMADLYQARFEGPVPDVKTNDGVVTIRYPRRLWVPGREQRVAEVMLSAAIQWRIVIQGGASGITVRRPSGVAARVHLKGWISSALVFDDQRYSEVGRSWKPFMLGCEASTQLFWFKQTVEQGK